MNSSDPVVQLSRTYVANVGTVVVDRVDLRLFQLRYFAHCMECTFCHDKCCSWGAMVDAVEVEAILRAAPKLEPFLGIPSSEWIQQDAWLPGADMRGGRYTRTAVKDGACVFLHRDGRGCQLHRFAVLQGEDYHPIKPMVCSLFGATWELGLLRPSHELIEHDLVCIDQGPTAYQAARHELGWYFGDGLLAELDALEAVECGVSGRLRLPLAP